MFSLTLIQMALLVIASVVGSNALSLVARRARRTVNPERRRHLLELREILERRLHQREKQAAYQGINADPSISMEIEDLRKKIEEIDDTLR